MPIIHGVPGAQPGVQVRRRWAAALLGSAVVAGTVGLTAGAGLLAAGTALASNGSQPGRLALHPASGAVTLTPAWSTAGGCPAGYQGSAEMSEFKASGAFGSRISTVVSTGLTAPFHGVLDYNVSLVLRLGADIGKGQTSEWAIGCYSGPGGTGKVRWVQSTFVTLSADGKSYSTSTSNRKRPSTSPDPTPTATGNGVGVPIDVQVSGATPTSTPTSTPTGSATPTVSGTPTPAPTATSTSLPAGAPATGAGGASHSGGTALIALGAAALAGSAVATGVAIRRKRGLARAGGPGPINPGG